MLLETRKRAHRTAAALIGVAGDFFPHRFLVQIDTRKAYTLAMTLMTHTLMRQTRRSSGLLRCVPVLAMLLLTAAAMGQDSDLWYALELMGSRCGETHTTVKTADGKVTTHSTMNLGIKRGNMDALEIAIESTFVETEDGKPVMMTTTKRLAAPPVTDTYIFAPDGSAELTTIQAGKKNTQQLPKPEGVWLTPAAAQKFIAQRVKAGAAEFTLRTIDPTEGLEPVTVKYDEFEPEKITIEGKTYDATKRRVTVNTKAMKGVKSTEYVDSEGEILRSETNLGGLRVVMIATSKKNVGVREAAPELMVSTFIRPDKPIADPRHARKLVLLLSVPEDSMPDLPNTGSQQAEVVTPASTRLTITTAPLAPASEADIKNETYLKATSMADSGDEKIKELAALAVKDVGEDPAAKAEACRRFVFKYIRKKNLGVGLATASQVAVSREGDCTEHGVLLAALLRANGIPSRAAVGLVFADQFMGQEGIFGYHMWAQALLTVDGKPRWVDLDGAISESIPFDATHITLDTTNLADGGGSAGLGAVAVILGRLQVKVEHAE